MGFALISLEVTFLKVSCFNNLDIASFSVFNHSSFGTSFSTNWLTPLSFPVYKGFLTFKDFCFSLITKSKASSSIFNCCSGVTCLKFSKALYFDNSDGDKNS